MPSRTTATILAAALLALTAACQPASIPPAPITQAADPTLPAHCHLRTEQGQPLPDPACTPGALNPQVTQANIGSTICQRGWASAQRARYLPSSLAAKYKRRVEAAYGVSRNADAEGDHLVPIELAGLPGPMPGATDFTANFWPESNDHPKPGFLNSKDIVENDLNRAVCAHQVTLSAAQHEIMKDWTSAEHDLGLK